jgi:hypothetical protein
VRRLIAAGSLALALSAGCGQPAAPLSVSIVPATPTAKAFITVAGLSSPELSALRNASLTAEQWQAIMRVSVDGPDETNPPVVGLYRVAASTLDFVPMFPFDAGRGYLVAIDPKKLTPPRAAESFRTVVVMPAGEARASSTTVTRVWPSSPVLPENLLRMYLEFSAPMAKEHGRDFLKLVEVGANGREVEVKDAFLALDVDFWSPDGRRYTLLFDPGRVKRGILPNDQVGRALKPGRKFAVIVDPKWRDQHGQPLAAPFRHEFTAGSAQMAALDPAAWKIQDPSSTVQGPLVIQFPKPLDHGLLQRAIGVERDGKAIAGDIAIGADETEWRFTPRSPWIAGSYDVIVLSILEDPMGNQIGRTFDVDKFTEIDKSPAPARSKLPFVVR